MARVTVEDCVDKVPNRFDLVMLAAHRAREIASGAPVTVERDNDKDPVVALREIADETVSVDTLQQSLIQSMQKHVDFDHPEDDDDILELLQSEQDVPGVVEPEAPAASDDAVAPQTEAPQAPDLG